MSDGCNYNLNKYVSDKLDKLKASDRNLRSVFLLMTGEDDQDKIFCESNDGYAITRVTYGQFREKSEKFGAVLSESLKGTAAGSIVGLYMNNCEEWLEVFWGLLMAGYRPLLMNTRISAEILEDILKQYGITTVVSDGREFTCRTVLLSEIKEDAGKICKAGMNGSAEANGNAGANSKAEFSAEKQGWADEILLMSSGTTGNVKICAYNGETMYYQICDSARIIQECKPMKQHYEGELKQLVFLPLYHVFGLVAMFMWFGFFCRTFVFLKDYSSETILNTVRRHKVTHIFSIPLLWNTVYSTVVRTAKEKGEYEKLMKGIAISEKLAGIPFLRKLFVKVAFASVREQIFGDSIKFLISGGSAISEDVMRFFNAIGYHLADGYGMTEIGITSVELSLNIRKLNSRSVGIPFASVEYSISDEGELLVRGQTMADVVMEGGKEVDRTTEGWFHTNDLAEFRDGRYYILGRHDDVIIGPNGENINPDILEEKINIDGVIDHCIVSRTVKGEKKPVLILQISPYMGCDAMKAVLEKAGQRVSELELSSMLSGIILTSNPLMEPDDFKLNRKKIADRLSKGLIKTADPDKDTVDVSVLTAKVAEIIGKVIGKEASEISATANLFYELGGTSLDYFTIVMELSKEFNVSFPNDSDTSFQTAAQFAEYIEKHR